MAWSTTILVAAGVYAAVGLAVAPRFLASGVGRVDPSARDAGWGFRLMILPGCVALWPWVVRRRRTGSGVTP